MNDYLFIFKIVELTNHLERVAIIEQIDSIELHYSIEPLQPALKN